MEIETIKPFEELYTTTKQLIICKSGRNAGKTRNVRDFLMTKNQELIKRDFIICRDSYSDIKDSIFASIEKYISTNKLYNTYDIRQHPLRIYNKKTKSNIYFVGIGGSDKNRTKSFETENPVEIVLFEELQQVADQESLEQAHASFRRLMSKTGKLIHLFNPPPQNAHWVNVWYTCKKDDPDYLCIETSWLDVAKFLSDLDIKEMLKCKLLEPEKYEWLYMGKTGGGFGSVYPQFKRSKHLISFEEAKEKFNKQRIESLIIGGDNAISVDGTCLCPIAIFENGQSAVLDLFYHDPKKDGDLSVAEMIPYMQKWLLELEKKYNLNDRARMTPIAFVIDGSIIGQELVKELRYVLDTSRYDIIAYTAKHVIEMAGNLKSVFARNMLYIIDYGGHFNYVRNKFERRQNILAEQIENLIWNERQTGFDPIIANDCVDALTYGANAIFKNIFNLYYVDKTIKTRKDFYDLDDLEGGAKL